MFRDKYKINSENIQEIRQILAIRYAIETVGYSTIRSMEISNSISAITSDIFSIFSYHYYEKT